MSLRSTILSASLCLVSLSTVAMSAAPAPQAAEPAPKYVPQHAQRLIAKTFTDVYEAWARKDGAALAKFTHPEKGVRFSPYAHVDEKNDQVFTAEKMKTFFEDKTVYDWGVMDGSGEPIKKTPSDYYQKFIISSDFKKLGSLSFNKTQGKGSITENQFQSYPNSIIGEYYIKQKDPKYAGMDWESLRLVFEELKGKWYLVGVIHNQWTS